MGKSDAQTDSGLPGRTPNESASADSQVAGGDTPLSEDEKWGFTDKKGGWPAETKAGVGIIFVLLCAFGFIAWNKYGLKDKTLAAIKGKGGEETVVQGTEQSDPIPDGSAMPTAFEQPEEPGRIAASEADFLGGQSEPADIAPAPPADDWGAAPAQDVAVAEPPAGRAAIDPDGFVGFGDPEPAASPMQPDPVAPAPVAAASPDAFDPNALDASSSPFGTDPEPEQPTPTNWSPESNVAATDMNAGDNFFGDTPAQPAPGRAAVDFGDDPVDGFTGFEDQPVAAAPAATQPAPSFDDAPAFDEPAPAPAPREPVVEFRSEPQPQPAPAQVVSQPATVARPPVNDPFDSPSPAGAQIDFDDAPVDSGNVFGPEPKRYDRGAVRRSEPVVVQQPAYRSPRDDVYKVRQSDTYWSISKTVYRTSRYYKALARYNERRVPDPRQMRPGTELLVPTTAVLEQKYPDLFPGIRRASATSVKIDTRQPAGLYFDSNDRPFYRVGSADSLSRIAQRHLGRSSRWTEIYKLNGSQLPRPEAVRPGMLLAMPMDASQVTRR